MSEDFPSMISHVSIGVANFERAIAFYDAVLATLGCTRMHSHPTAAVYGRTFPEFWMQIPIDGKPAGVGNGTHFGFFARSRDEVQAFWDAALKAGATPDGEPGPREDYGPQYFGCFVRDLDGHKIEATYWDAQQDGSS